MGRRAVPQRSPSYTEIIGPPRELFLIFSLLFLYKVSLCGLRRQSWCRRMNYPDVVQLRYILIVYSYGLRKKLLKIPSTPTTLEIKHACTRRKVWSWQRDLLERNRRRHRTQMSPGPVGQDVKRKNGRFARHTLHGLGGFLTLLTSKFWRQRGKF